uniref:Uncharacterized protein n=1 Tax=Alexandrium monilatum TaxID=311494 RepID=A0A7S4W184_9DINO
MQQLMVMVELMSMPADGPSADVIPVKIGGFEFPDDQYYAKHLPLIWPEDAREAETRIRAFFKRIAIVLDIAGADAILQKEVDTIFSRVQSRSLSKKRNVMSEETKMAIRSSQERAGHDRKLTLELPDAQYCSIEI